MCSRKRTETSRGRPGVTKETGHPPYGRKGKKKPQGDSCAIAIYWAGRVMCPLLAFVLLSCPLSPGLSLVAVCASYTGFSEYFLSSIALFPYLLLSLRFLNFVVSHLSRLSYWTFPRPPSSCSFFIASCSYFYWMHYLLISLRTFIFLRCLLFPVLSTYCRLHFSLCWSWQISVLILQCQENF